MNTTRIVLVTKRTPYEELLAKHGTHGNAAFLLESRGDSIARYALMHTRYREAVAVVEEQLPKDVAHTYVVHTDVPRFHFRQGDLVVAVGPDGLFVNLAKYLDGQPVLTVNPDASIIDGVVMRVAPEKSGTYVRHVLSETATYDEVVLARATTPEGGQLLAVNDFLVGRRDHLSARYSITYKGRTERQSSSGVLVSTGMGASGWMSSIKTAVAAGARGQPVLPSDPGWDEARLIFAVREPFPSRSTGSSIVYGNVTEKEPLSITSDMPEGGVVFSDGVPGDALLLPAGMAVTIGLARHTVRLVRP